ncbi:hypothetical protein [Candidatus Mycoplasma haematohominis]|uniref:hypothetical protein n=1 Tax=Candidatus Mycoplasma haematohominis TaxID=1494318 RepID=UPI001C0A6DCD|nr:hypothetical protein [Candidatus Mycoplasma haemohominis]
MKINWEALTPSEIEVLKNPFKPTIISGWSKKDTHKIASIKIRNLISLKKIERPEQILICSYDPKDLDLFKLQLKNTLEEDQKFWINHIEYQEYKDIEKRYLSKRKMSDGTEKLQVNNMQMAKDKKLVFLLGNISSQPQQIKKAVVKILFKHVIIFFWQYEKDDMSSFGSPDEYISINKKTIENAIQIYPQHQIEIDDNEINKIINSTEEIPFDSYWIVKKIQEIQQQGRSYKDCLIFTDTEEEKRKYNLIFPEVFQNEFKILLDWLEIANYFYYEQIEKPLLNSVTKYKYEYLYIQDEEEIKKVIKNIQNITKIEEIFQELGISQQFSNSNPEIWKIFQSIIKNYPLKKDLKAIKERIKEKSKEINYQLAKTKSEASNPKPKFAFLTKKEEPTSEELSLAKEKIFSYFPHENLTYKEYDPIAHKSTPTIFISNTNTRQDAIYNYKDKPTLLEGLTEEELIHDIKERVAILCQHNTPTEKIFIVSSDPQKWQNHLIKYDDIQCCSFYDFLNILTECNKKIEPVITKKILIQTCLEKNSVPEKNWNKFYQIINSLYKQEEEKNKNIKNLEKSSLKNSLNPEELKTLEQTYKLFKDIKKENQHFIDYLNAHTILKDKEGSEIQKACYQTIGALIVTDYHLLAPEELSVLNNIVQYIESVLIISKQNTSIYQNEEQIKNFRNQFNIFENKKLSEEYSQTSNYSLSLINKLTNSNLTNPNVQGKQPISYITTSLKEEIDWVKSKIKNLSNATIIVPNQENITPLRKEFPNTTILKIQDIEDKVWENVFIMHLNDNFGTWSHKHIHSRLFYKALTSSSKQLFLSSNSKKISPFLQEIKELTTIESEHEEELKTKPIPEKEQKPEPEVEQKQEELTKIFEYPYEVESYHFKSNKERCIEINKRILEVESCGKSYLILTTDEYHENQILSYCFQNKNLQFHINKFIKKILTLSVINDVRIIFSDLKFLFLQDPQFKKLFRGEWSDCMTLIETINKCKQHIKEEQNPTNLLQNVFKTIKIWIKSGQNLDDESKKQIIEDIEDTIDDCKNLNEFISEVSRNDTQIKKYTEITDKKFDYILILIDNLKHIVSCEKIWGTKVKEKMLLFIKDNL